MSELVIPKQLLKYLKDVSYKDVSCRSNSKTYRFNNGLYLKIDDKDELKREYQMSSIFFKLGIGVKVIEYLSIDKDYLLTKEADGVDLTHSLDNPYQLCSIVAEALKKLHSVPIKGIPISNRYERYIESLNGPYEGGYYDPSILLKGYKMSKSEAWEIMHKNAHLLNADTFIHGDACLPNIMANNNSFTSFIDTGLSGVGDKHIDIYWALWSIEYNLKTSDYNQYFLDLLGKDYYSMDALLSIMAFEVFG